MARTQAGDRVSKVYQALTEDLVKEYSRVSKATMIRTLDPKNVDKTAPRYLAEMTRQGKKLSNNYLHISTNYIKTFSEVEGVRVNPNELKDIARPFDTQRFQKRLMGSGVYGYKQKVTRSGLNVVTLGDNNKFFAQSVSNAAGDFAKQVLTSGRDTVVGVSTQTVAYIGYARVPDGNACDFCMMLTTRNDYISLESAGFEAHRNCACSPEPVADGWTPDGQALERYDAYKDKQDELNEAGGWDNTAQRLEEKREARDMASDKPEGEKINKNEVLSELMN